MNTPQNQNHAFVPDKKSRKPAVLIVLIVLLLGAIAVMSVMYYNLRKDSAEQVRLLDEEKNQLSNELKRMYFEYDSLHSENDSMNVKLDAEKEKIQRLLSINASNVATIRLYKKELKTLRDIMKSYIVQIDSLNQRNKILSEENIMVRQQLQTAEKDKMELKKSKEELSSKVEVASILSAKDIRPVPLNKRSRDTDKADKVEKVRTCFILRENPIVPAGEKTIYLRIYRPDGAVLTSFADDTFSVGSETLTYSEKRTVEYENKDIEVCIYWDRTEPLMEGEYIVELYAGSNLIGSSSFALR